MLLIPQRGIPRDAADPFAERTGRAASTDWPILGGRFRFVSGSAALLHRVEVAFDGLPPHRLSLSPPEFRVELRLLPRRGSLVGATEPPPLQLQSGAGVLVGVMDAANYVVVAPQQRRALIVVSGDLLDHPYHLRCELVEFVVFLLATRAMGLVPLHGACVGARGRGVLVLGASGAGKSTLALHSLLGGLELLADDAVFVQPDTMRATGVANYLHVRADALGALGDAEAERWIRQAPVIRRRSGVEKFEPDLRQGPRPTAATPLAVVGAVLLSAGITDAPRAVLSPIPDELLPTRLAADQPYAAGQPGWQGFVQRLRRLGVQQLARGAHPRDSVDALRRLLA